MAGPAPAPDLDGDLDVDCDDLAVFQAAFGSMAGDPAFLAAADLHPDGQIDGRDLVLFLRDLPPGLECQPILDPDRFIPIDSAGNPIENMVVQAGPNGALPPLEFRPSGRSLRGTEGGLRIRMPDGATLVERQGRPQVEFRRAEAFFGADSPLQFTDSLRRLGASTARLPVDGVSAGELAVAFGQSETAGLPTRFFGSFPFRWVGGVLSDAGIVGARFVPDVPQLPLPGISGDYPGFRIDLLDSGAVRIPFHGTWDVPDGTSNPPRLAVPAAHPLWITLRADGTVAASGRADLAFPDGPSFTVDAILDDPQYRLQIAANGLLVPAVGTLSDLLPANPGACLPAGSSDAELDQATRCLLSFARAYHLFGAAAIGATPAEASTGAPASPPEAMDLAGAVLEAWAHSGLTPAAHSLPVQGLREALGQAGRSAAAAGDLTTVMRYRLALLRLRQAIEQGGLEDDADATADLETALIEIDAAAVARSREPTALNSWTAVREAMAMLVEAESIRQLLGRPENPDLMAAVTAILDRFTAQETAAWGVGRDTYTPESNPVIRGMNRFVAFQHLHDLVDLMAQAQLLGLEGGISGPVAEAMGQLAVRLFTVTDAAFAAAERRPDYPAALAALVDLVDLVAWRQLGVFPDVPQLDHLPGPDELGDYATRMGPLLDAELGRMRSTQGLARRAAEIDRLLKVLNEMPSGVTFAPGAFQRAYDGMEETLANDIAILEVITDLDHLLLLLEAGIRHEELRVRFGFPATADWMTVRLPPVLERLRGQTQAQRGWSQLYRAVRLLLNEADRLDVTSGPAADRKAYLAYTVPLLAAARTVGAAIWADEDARRGAVDPALLAADMILPGDIYLDRISGAVAYNRQSGFLSGAFAGSARLPKFDAALTVNSASLTSGGAFDLSLHGTAGLPPGDPAVVFSLPARRPLHVSYAPKAGLRFSGAARADFSNGLSFQSYWRLEDPIYEFGLAAEGMRLDLANELTLLMPAIDEGAGEVFVEEVGKELNAYYRSMNAAMESLLPLTELPVVDTREIGEPPDFEPPAVTVEFDALEAWANSTLANVNERINGSYSNSVEEISKLLEALVAESESAADELIEERQSWEYEVMFLGALRLVRFALERLEAEQPSPVRSHATREPGEGTASPRALLEAALRAKYAALQKAIADHPAQNLEEAIAQGRALLLIYQESLELDLTGFEGASDAANEIMARGKQMEYARLGLDPNTGQVVNRELFNSFPLDELQRARTRITVWAADTQGMGGGDLTWADANEHVSRRRVEIMYDKLEHATTDKERIRWALTIFHEGVEQQNYGALEGSPDLAYEGWHTYLRAIEPSARECREHGVDVRYCGDFRENYRFANETHKRLLEEKNRSIRETVGELEGIKPFEPPEPPPPEAPTEPEPDERRFLEFLLRELGRFEIDIDLDLGNLIDELVRFELGEITYSLSVPGSVSGSGLTASEELLRRLVDVGVWIHARRPEDEALLSEWRLTLENLTHEFTAVAEAQKAWWWLSRYTELLHQAAERYREQANEALATSLDEAGTASVLASKHIAEDFATLLAAVHLEEVVFALPGDLEVQRVFGSVYYDRSIPYFRGAFGGRVAFTEIDALFEIREASLDSNGSFAIDAFTSTPLPFDGVRLDAGIDVVGSPAGLDYASGNGTLFMDTGEEFSAGLTYDDVAKQLSCTTSVENLNLVFTDDFVLFHAGFGFTVSTVHPKGRFTAAGSAGLFAKEESLPAELTGADFELHVEDLTTTFAYQEDGVSVSLDNGTLHLPDMFSPQLCSGSTGGGPVVVLSPVTKIQVAYTTDPEPAVGFAGSLAVRNIGFEVPGIADLAVEVCSATVDFDGRNLPSFSHLSGSVSLPLTTGPQVVDLDNVVWRWDGFPEARIRIRNNIPVFDEGGFAFTLLASNPEGCEFSGLVISNTTAGVPYFELAGGLELTVPLDTMARENGDQITAAACGSLSVIPGEVPEFELLSLSVGGRFRLGGPSGFLVDGTLSAERVRYLFDQSPETPFILRLTGTLGIPDGPAFTLQDAKFTFVGEDLPRFTIKGLQVASGELDLLEGLPVNVHTAGVVFVEETLPLPDLLYPDNVELSLSGDVSFPPFFEGQVDDLRARLDAAGDFYVDANGVGIGLTDIPLGPLVLTGQVYVGGLQDPSRWFFAGRLGGQVTGQDAKVVALVAFNNEGLFGVCLDVNAGPAGIPLGQTTLILTGVQGGLSFFGGVGDPCDFTQTYKVGENGRPQPGTGQMTRSAYGPPRNPVVITWEELAIYQELYEQEQALRGAVDPAVLAQQLPNGYALRGPTPRSGVEGIDCPTGDCPPPTVGILCQPHPDTETHPNRVIYKFTSISEETLNDFGIDENSLPGNAADIAIRISEPVRAFLQDALLTPLDPALLGELFDDYEGFILDSLDTMEATLSNVVHEAAAAALGDPDKTVYEAVVDTLYAGVPCPEISLKVQATLSQALISTFLSADVGAVMGTDITRQFVDSAGMVGEINLLGFPVGGGEVFVALTDAAGMPNPSVCGTVEASIGPLSMGEGAFLYACPGCVDGLLAQAEALIRCVGEEVTDEVLRRVAPELEGHSPADLAAEMSPDLVFSYLGELFSVTNPPTGFYEGLGGCVMDAILGSWDTVQPEFAICTDTTPKLFGLPMGEGAGGVTGLANKTELLVQFYFSPTYMLATINHMNFFPFAAMDEATFGMGLAVPDRLDVLMGGLTGAFQSSEDYFQFVEENYAYMLENSTFTVGYALRPFGLEMLDGQARVIMPNLTDPPVFRSPKWKAPEDPTRPVNDPARDYPSRLEVLLGAVGQNKLADAYWKGNEEDLFQVFPAGSDDYLTVSNNALSFARDYFPHGGIVGAARLTMPPALVDAPPPVFYEILDEDAELLDRLGSALEYIDGYVLNSNVPVGELAFYIPAPNPPLDLEDMDFMTMLDGIRNFSIDDLDTLYPQEAAFMQGTFDGRLIGIDIARGSILAIPEDVGNNRPAKFQVTGEIPEGSWFDPFVDEVTLEYEITGPPPYPLSVAFSNAYTTAETAWVSGVTGDMESAIKVVYTNFTDYLPKVSMELEVDNFHVPPELSLLMSPLSADVGIYAYSVRFDPDETGSNPVAIARHDGGIAFRGAFRFADLVNISNAELAVSAPLPPELLPRLSGQLQAPLIPFFPNSNGLHDVMLAFDSNPDVGGAYLAGAGQLDAFNIGLLAVQPLHGGNRIASTLSVLRGPDDLPQITLTNDPARISMPIFGPSLGLTMHGVNGTSAPFTFSTEGPWDAAVTLNGDVEIKDPTGSEVLLTVDAGDVVRAAFTGDGLSAGTMHIVIRGGATITVFPDIDDLRREVAIGALGSEVSLYVSTDGTFALDVTLPPLHFEMFEIAGAGGGDLSAHLGSDGVTVDPAFLEVHGVSGDLLELQTFIIEADGTFDVSVVAPDWGIPDYFALTEGEMRLRREADGVVKLHLAGQDVVLFPDHPEIEKTFASLIETLEVESTGRFYYDLSQKGGPLSFGIPSTCSVSGRVEIGYEPDTRTPNTWYGPTSFDFGRVAEGISATDTLTIGNNGDVPVDVAAVSGLPSAFTVSPYAIHIEGHSQAEITVTFTPPDSGGYAGHVYLRSSAFASTVEIPVSGSGGGAPRYYQTHDELRFPPRFIAALAYQRFRIGNIGSVPMSVTRMDITGPYSLFPSAPALPFSLGAGAEREFTVKFTAPSSGPTSGRITVETVTAGTHTIELIGSSRHERWVAERVGDGEEDGDFFDLGMRTAERGWAVGVDGLFETQTGGRGWTRRDETDEELYGQAFEQAMADAVLWLHLEEPAGSTRFVDSSGNGHHGTSGGLNLPQAGRPSIRNGRCVEFDGVNDVIDTAAFDLDDDFTVSLWVNPDTTADGQAFIGKHDSAGNNQFIMGFFGGGYFLHLGNTSYAMGTKATGWQHLVAVGRKSAPGITHLTYYRGGKVLWERDYSTVMGNVGGGLAWTLGQEWDGGGPRRGDFFGGRMDEVAIFNRALEADEVGYLAASPPRGVAVGARGTLLETETDGVAWTKVRDSVVSDPDCTWHDAAFTWDRRVVLAGTRSGIPVIALETNFQEYAIVQSGPGAGAFRSIATKHFPGPIIHGSTDFAMAVGDNELAFYSTDRGRTWNGNQNGLPTGVNLRGCAFDENSIYAGGNDGRVYRFQGSSWSPLAGLQGAAIYDVACLDHANHVFACGEDGEVFEWDDGAVARETAEDRHLYAIDVRGPATAGAQSLRSFSEAVTIWVAGTGGGIFQRGDDDLAGPVAVLSTGSLDFGAVGPGSAGFGLVSLRNAGYADLVVTSIQVTAGPFAATPVSMLPVGRHEEIAFRVAYTPDGSSALDMGELEVLCNDPDGPVLVQLTGNAPSTAWEPAPLSPQSVLSISFPSDTVGYAATRQHLYKTVDGGTTWSELAIALLPGTYLDALWFVDANYGWAAGKGIILATEDGGAHWSVQQSGFSQYVGDVHFPTRFTGIVVRRLGGKGIPGDVLYTSDGGKTWDQWTEGGGGFNGRCGWASPVSFAAASGNTIYAPGPFTWMTFPDGTTIYELFFDPAGDGWAVGTGGTVRRYDSGANTWEPPVDDAVLGSLPLADVAFSDEDTGWIAGWDRIFRSDDGGRRWEVEYEAPGCQFRAIAARPGKAAWAGGEVSGTGTGVVWRLRDRPTVSRGVLVSAADLTWPEHDVGTAGNQLLVVRNVGTAPVRLGMVRLRDETGAFSLVNPPGPGLTLGPMAQFFLRIQYAPQSGGTHEAVIEVHSDAVQGLLTTRLRGNAYDPPGTIRFDTRPSGLKLYVDGAEYTAPVAFAVTEVAWGNVQWKTGSTHVITVAEGQTNAQDTAYVFHSWEPSASRSFTVTATRATASRTAKYLVAGRVEEAPSPPPALRGPRSPPATPRGPYIRVTDAGLAIPPLGDFGVQGEMLLSSRSFEASLYSQPVHIPPEAPHLLEVSRGTWSVNYVEGSHFHARVNRPTVRVLGKPVGTGAELAVNLGSSGAADLHFATTDDLVLLPGAVEFGPCSLDYVDNLAAVALDIGGSVRLLQLPDGWAHEEVVSLHVDQSFPIRIPFVPDPLVDLSTPLGTADFLTLRGGDVYLTRDGQGALGLALEDYTVDLFGTELARNVSAGVGLNGVLTLDASMSGKDVRLAPSEFRLASSGSAALRWDMQTPSFALTVPDVVLKQPTLCIHNVWPCDGIELVSSFTFDSQGDIDPVTIPLVDLDVSFSFDGVSIDNSGTLENNYIRVGRERGVTQFELRDRRTFFGSSMQLALDVDSAGNVVGTFDGWLAFDFSKLGLGRVNLKHVSMTYDSAADCRFYGFVPDVLFHDWHVYAFGEACDARICTDTWLLGPVCIP